MCDFFSSLVIILRVYVPECLFILRVYMPECLFTRQVRMVCGYSRKDTGIHFLNIPSRSALWGVASNSFFVGPCPGIIHLLFCPPPIVATSFHNNPQELPWFSSPLSTGCWPPQRWHINLSHIFFWTHCSVTASFMRRILFLSSKLIIWNTEPVQNSHVPRNLAYTIKLAEQTCQFLYIFIPGFRPWPGLWPPRPPNTSLPPSPAGGAHFSLLAPLRLLFLKPLESWPSGLFSSTHLSEPYA